MTSRTCPSSSRPATPSCTARITHPEPRAASSLPPSEFDEYAARHGLLLPASYHVVTTNPPYVTVSDKALSSVYRDLYESCGGSYALPVPFMELAFGLAHTGRSSGPGRPTHFQLLHEA
ncbi:hypothetical protein GCM10011428_60880 [Streptomyces violaceus]